MSQTMQQKLLLAKHAAEVVKTKPATSDQLKLLELTNKVDRGMTHLDAVRLHFKKRVEQARRISSFGK